MVGFALIAFPFVLLGFVLIMGRVEEPLSHISTESTERELEHFLESANASEMNTLVREGTEPAMHRFRLRLRLGTGRRRRRTRHG